MKTKHIFSIIIAGVVSFGGIFLYFKYLFKSPAFLKIFGLLALIFIIYLMVDWVAPIFKNKES